MRVHYRIGKQIVVTNSTQREEVRHFQECVGMGIARNVLNLMIWSHSMI